MKNLILIACVILFAACNKENDVANKLSGDATITNVAFFPWYAGMNSGAEFHVTISVPDPAAIKYIKLYKVPFLLRWEVENPTSGLYKMYDRISEFPNGTPENYYLVFIKTDGTISEGKPFEVCRTCKWTK